MERVVKISVSEKIFFCSLGIFTYGLYGVMNPSILDLKTSLTSWVYLLSPVAAMLLYLFQKGIDGSAMEFDFSFSVKRFLVKIGFATLLSFSLAYFLNQSLVGDELFYATYGYSHSIELLEIIGRNFHSLDSLDVSIVMRLISFCILFGFGLFVCVLILSNRHSNLFFGIIILSSLVIARLSLSYLGGNGLAHAPLAAAFTLFPGTLFGLSDLAIQSGQIMAYIVFGYFIFIRASSALGSNWIGLAVTLALFTIPAMFFLSSVLEPVIWSIICSTVVLCFLVDDNFDQHKLLIYFAVFLAFFRIAAIFAIIPVVSHMLLNRTLSGDFQSKLGTFTATLRPAVIFAPFFIFSYLKESAATEGSTVTLSEIFGALIDGTIWSLYVDVISPYWLALFGFLIILSLRSKFTQVSIIYLVFLTIIFFSLNERVWGFSKYRIEVFIPLLISLILSTLGRVNSRLFRNSIGLTGVFFIIFNLKLISDFPSTCSKNSGGLGDQLLNVELDYGCNYLSRVPFNFSNAIDYVRSRSALAETYIPGVYYGALIHGLNGSNVSNFLAAKQIFEDQKELNSESVLHGHDANPDAIHEDSRIGYVLLGYVANLEHIKSSLMLRGWRLVYTDINPNGFGLETLILQRPAKSVVPAVDSGI